MSVAFNSSAIYPKDSEEESSTFNFTFDRPEVYSYFCQIHPHMSGTVYVNADETQSELISTIYTNTKNIIIAMLHDTAYNNKYEQGFFIPSNAYIHQTVE